MKRDLFAEIASGFDALRRMREEDGRQSWIGSFWEANANIIIGFSLNYCINLATLPLLWDPAQPKSSAFYIGIVFTVVSYVRQLVLRRWFNGKAQPK